MATDKTNLKGPDALLANIGKSIMFKAMVYSIIGHAVFTGATSVSLFRDWASDWEKFGLKAPSAINAIRTKENREAEEAKRKQEREEKAAKEARAAEEAKAAAATNKTAAASAPAAGGAGAAATDGAGAAATDGAGAAATDADGKKKPPELKPLPKAKDFEYGGDLDLE